MVKPMPLDDFRATRLVLELEDFLIAPEEESPPTDLVDEETWCDITTLPTDVSIRTSNHHGKLLSMLCGLQGAWIEAAGEPVEADRADQLYLNILDAANDFQAAIFDSLCGYYRASISCLRSVLELIVIGTYCQACGKGIEYQQWRSGQATMSFSRACDKLGRVETIRNLELHLWDTVKDSLFHHKTDKYPGGAVRRQYSRLSDYSHSRPGFAEFDLWDGTGPVYAPDAFIGTTQLHLETAILCFIMIKIGRPDFGLPMPAQELFQSERIHPTKVTRAAYQNLFP